MVSFDTKIRIDFYLPLFFTSKIFVCELILKQVKIYIVPSNVIPSLPL